MNRKKQRFNLVQRVIFIFGLIVLSGLFGFLIYESGQHNKQPPNLETSLKHYPEVPQHSYRVLVKNTGEETAKNASLFVNLYQEGALQESATLSIDFVPPGSEVEGWVVFKYPATPNDSVVVSSMTYLVP